MSGQQLPAAFPPYPKPSSGANDFKRSRYILYDQMIEEYKTTKYMLDRVAGSQDDEYITLTSIPEQLEAIYGPIEKSDPIFLLYVEEFKRSREETMQMCCKVVDAARETPYAEMTLFKKAEAILSKIKTTFSAAEIDSFDLNPYTNQLTMDHFVLPRKALTYEHIVHHKNASELSVDDVCAEDPATDGELPQSMSTREFDGFGFFDPKFHGVFVENVPFQVGTALASKFTKWIQKYPFGINPSVAEECHQDFFGYRIEYKPLGYSDLLCMMRGIPDICWVRSDDFSLPQPLRTLVFPAGVAGSICSVKKLLQRFWQNYLCMTSTLDSPCLLEKSWDLLRKFIGLKEDEFSPAHWGFPTVEAFIRYCIGYFKYRHLHIVIPVGTWGSEEGDDPVQPTLFVFHGLICKLPSSFQLLGVEVDEDIVIPSVSEKQEASKISETFLKQEDLKEWVADDIKPGDTILCRHGFSLRPNLFSLVREDQTMLNIALRQTIR